jgi:predicted small lipoprotein YifL
MKKQFNIFKSLLVLVLFVSISVCGLAQPPPPPPPPANGHGGTGNSPAGPSSPIGDGMYILIGLAGLYAGKKVYDYRKAAELE